MNIEEIIRNLLIEMRPLLEKKVIIFLSGGSINTEILLKVLGEFKNVHYTFVISENGEKMLNMEAVSQLNGHIIHSVEELEEVLVSTELILIPVLTRNTLAKIALGIADNLVTTGIARAIMMNKETIAVRDSFSHLNQVNRLNGLADNDEYNGMLDEYEKRLQHFGIKFVDLAEFKTTVNTKLTCKAFESANELSHDEQQPADIVTESSILTLAELRNAKQQGTIFLKKGTRITPLAKEFIDQKKVEIKWV